MPVPTIDFMKVNTTSGSGGLFALPGDFTGGEQEYGKWLKAKFRENIGARQMLGCYARFLGAFRAGINPFNWVPSQQSLGNSAAG